jgi:hypothetical protein
MTYRAAHIQIAIWTAVTALLCWPLMPAAAVVCAAVGLGAMLLLRETKR